MRASIKYKRSVAVVADILTVSLLAQVLAQSVPIINRVIAKSLDVKENEIEEAIDDGQFQDVVREKIIEKTQGEKTTEPPDAAADTLMTSWIVETRKVLAARRQEYLSEARISFIVALSALILGILLVFSGVILIFTVGLQAGAVTSSSSIVTGIVCALAFQFNQQAHDRLDGLAKEMNALDNVYIAISLASEISDQIKRDSAIEEVIRKIYPGKRQNLTP
jgi:ABC-type multidrug transport system fused ATPase/permease subunit